ncbi:MAG: hypothetical protein SVR81_11285, partial [Chloroflexota bacterium]|nr:hypothetical protein [Chloroflexota bacterium]
AVIGNPPYDVLSETELGSDISCDLDFFDAHKVYQPAMIGSRNVFKLFICKGTHLLSCAALFGSD